MPNQEKTPLEQKFLRLPRFIEFDRDIKPELDRAGISRDTFDKDQKANPNNIPQERLLVYAEIFNCKVSDLTDLKKANQFDH